ncbi:hypothetical protein RFI_17478 [Reticulomyxa filosa]|uniref:Cytoplasmic dynein 2 heavy chain 1 AAA+ ATPase domain-containing protein n=1 Tax=Reticulomyxa filosa TaxID=46433 RepID=X6N0F0_RETFI|nr:hypothetical protein RFI_17478 [Reticulomyxa filosa]|eukprot:ETO19755.1 hypothetical protein RFI_17478 [Reticulomyxa filosa]
MIHLSQEDIPFHVIVHSWLSKQPIAPAMQTQVQGWMHDIFLKAVHLLHQQMINSNEPIFVIRTTIIGLLRSSLCHLDMDNFSDMNKINKKEFVVQCIRGLTCNLTYKFKQQLALEILKLSEETVSNGLNRDNIGCIYFDPQHNAIRHYDNVALSKQHQDILSKLYTDQVLDVDNIPMIMYVMKLNIKIKIHICIRHIKKNYTYN